MDIESFHDAMARIEAQAGDADPVLVVDGVRLQTIEISETQIHLGQLHLVGDEGEHAFDLRRIGSFEPDGFCFRYASENGARQVVRLVAA